MQRSGQRRRCSCRRSRRRAASSTGGCRKRCRCRATNTTVKWASTKHRGKAHVRDRINVRNTVKNHRTTRNCDIARRCRHSTSFFSTEADGKLNSERTAAHARLAEAETKSTRASSGDQIQAGEDHVQHQRCSEDQNRWRLRRESRSEGEVGVSIGTFSARSRQGNRSGRAIRGDGGSLQSGVAAIWRRRPHETEADEGGSSRSIWVTAEVSIGGGREKNQ
mgnify:CR=1 FL=1